MAERSVHLRIGRTDRRHPEPRSSKTTAICAIALPIGVRVSITISVTISRQPCSSDRRIGRAKSSVQRLALSTLVKISAPTSPTSSNASAARNRFRDSGGTPPETPSSATQVRSQPLLSATRWRMSARLGSPSFRGSEVAAAGRSFRGAGIPGLVRPDQCVGDLQRLQGWRVQPGDLRPGRPDPGFPADLANRQYGRPHLLREDIAIIRPEEIRRLPEGRAFVVAENGKPIIARLSRCIDGKTGARLLAGQAVFALNWPTDPA
jgi:hypothetical protein